jgi:hypothetical protein
LPTPPVTPSNTPDPTVTPEVTPSLSVDPTGDVKGGFYACLKTASTACISINSNGTVVAASCGVYGEWVVNGFRDGEDGSDYTFTATQEFPYPVASGPTSGNLGTTKSWCLGPPTSGSEWTQVIVVTITGPKGDSDDIRLALTVEGSGEIL